MVNLCDFKVSNYPDGHKHIVSDKDLHGDFTLVVSIKSFDDLFLIAQIKAIHPELTHLTINYMLAARCDRRFSPGEALDLKIVCDFINSLGFEYIHVLKPHSPATLEHLTQNACEIDVTQRLIDLLRSDLAREKVCFVSPDEGASRWVNNHYLEPILQGQKKRDSKTGAVVGVDFYRAETIGAFGKVIPGRNMVTDYYDYTNFAIIDDLCDGGGTFIAIAKEIHNLLPNAKIYLIVTHAIFSKGFEPFEGHIEHIYCTDSYAKFSNPLVTQIEV